MDFAENCVFPQTRFPQLLLIRRPHAAQPVLDRFGPRWSRIRHYQRGLLRGLQGHRDHDIQRVQRVLPGWARVVTAVIRRS